MALSNIFKKGSPSSPILLNAIPNRIEKITIAKILSLVNNNEKSLTLMAVIVLSKIFNSTSSAASPVSNTSSIALESLGLTNLTAYVDIIPIVAAINETTMNVPIIDTNSFPNLLGCFIFAIEVVIVRNINGTIITNIMFINNSPNGASILAFSP